MKVMIDARAASNEITGVGKYIIRLAEGLVKRGLDVTLLYHREPKYLVEKIERKIIPGENRFAWEQIKLPKVLNAQKVDLYHATWNYGIPFFYTGASVLTVHDVIPLKVKEYFLGKKLLTLPEYLVSLYSSLMKADWVIADSRSSASDIKSVFPFYHRPIDIINLAVDAPKFARGSPYRCNSPYLIYFGGIDKRKNIPGLMQAFSRSKASKNFRLVIVGRYSSILKDDAQRLRIADKTDFIDYVSEEEKYRLLKEATVLVYPSFYEGFGIPPLEAMAVGTPVITSNVSSLPEVVGGAAILVNPKNVREIAIEIDRLVTDRNLQRLLSIKGLEQVKKFSWDKMVNETIQVYRRVLKR